MKMSCCHAQLLSLEILPLKCLSVALCTNKLFIQCCRSYYQASHIAHKKVTVYEVLAFEDFISCVHVLH
jgi:hypothetical protein